MATKVIYFTIAGQSERAEFRTDFPADDVKGKVGFCVCILLLMVLYAALVVGVCVYVYQGYTDFSGWSIIDNNTENLIKQV